MAWQKLPGSKNVSFHSRSGTVAHGKSAHELTPLGTVRRVAVGQFEAHVLDDHPLLNPAAVDPRYFTDPVQAAALVTSQPYLISSPPPG